MADQPTDSREGFKPVGEYENEVSGPIEGSEVVWGTEPLEEARDLDSEPRQSLALHHRSRRSHHASSGSSGEYVYNSLRQGSGGYDDGYYSESSRRHHSSDSYDDGYYSESSRRHHSSDSYDDGYRHSSSHRHHSDSYYDDDYDDGYHHSHSSRHYHSSSRHQHSSDNDFGNSRSSRHKNPGRLASHHRSRHHHHRHHHSSSEPGPEYVPAYESMAINIGSAEAEYIGTAEVPPAIEHTAVAGRIPMSDAQAAGGAVRTDDTYYAVQSSSGSGREPLPSADRAPGALSSAIAAARSANPPTTYDASSIESSSSRRRRKKMEKRKTFLGALIRILIVFIVLIIAGIGGLVYLRYHGQKTMTHKGEDIGLTMDKDNMPEDVEEVEDEGKTITYKGEKYRYNENLSAILFLGSDRTLDQQEDRDSVIGINGQADTILLGIIDNTNKNISFINVNRDTMTSVAQYTPDGDYAGDKQMQICLAYSYGKDNKEGCEMMAAAVSNLLYGIPIDSYARISYDAVPMLNDSVGGVSVKVLEDMTSMDPELVKGATVTLRGNQALRYIRWRNQEVIETNELRMARQKQYFYAFMKRTIDATRADITLPLGLYNNAKPYMTTGITPSQVTYLASKVLEYGVSDDAIHSIKGTSTDGANGWIEFHADDIQLYEMILDTFYNKVER